MKRWSQRAVHRACNLLRGSWPAALAWLCIAHGAVAAPLPGVGTLPVVGPVIGNLPATLGNTVNGVTGLGSSALGDVRSLRIQQLVATQGRQVELDPKGNPMVRSQIVAISPTPELLAAALKLGFTVISSRMLEALGIDEVVLQAPEHSSTRKALKSLQALDPAGAFDFNHIYFESGEEPASSAAPAASADNAGVAAPPGEVMTAPMRIGLIDGGIDASHPVFTGTQLHLHGCADRPVASAHGTEVASLLSGEQRAFSGAAPHAELYAADVYCGQPTGGAVAAVVEALEWLAQSKVPVINLSLVGPANATLAAVVRILVARGYLLVAAVGNDGPSAPALYPASYPGVIGVTAVDARRKVLLEAGRGPQVHFAAPGADMLAAAPGATFAEVRGTSFAAPIVAGLLARGLHAPDPQAASTVLAALDGQALSLGSPSHNPVYGFGLVGEAIRTPVAADLPHAPKH